MFTRNYYKMLAAKIAYDGTLYNAKTWNNTDYTVGYNNGMAFCEDNTSAAYANIRLLQTSISSNGGVILGTGDTVSTLDDYKLSGDLITTFTYSSSITKTADENGITIQALYTITNTGDSAFTIKEIGMICNPSSTYQQTQYKVLLERTVLDNPVTIEASGIGQVTYTIRLDFPTA